MTVQEQTGGQVGTEEVIQYEVNNGVATIWLNRPHVKNCINWDLLMAFGQALDRAEEDDDARVVVIRGRGNTFCAGSDLNLLDSEFLGTTNASVKIAQDLGADVRPRVQPPEADDRGRRGTTRSPAASS